MTTAASRTLAVPREWLQDRRLIRLLKNSSTLLAGNAMAGVLGLGSIALTVRALGTEAFGVLVLITTYALMIDTLVNFQSWQAVTRYGARALEQGSDREFKSLVKFGFLLDICTAVTATILAILAAWFVVRWQGWDAWLVPMCTFYSLTLLFNIAGTPTAVLRLFDRFDLVVYSQVLGAVIRFVGATAAFLMHGDLWVFLIVWAVGDVLGQSARIAFSFRELSSRHRAGVMSASLKGVTRTFDGLWRFVWTTNIHSSIKLALKEVDVLLIGLWLGVSGAGMYKIVKAVGSRVGTLATPMQQAIYPDLARLAATREYSGLASLVLKPVAMVTVAGACAVGLFVLFGRSLITLAFGAEFHVAFVPMLIYLVGTFIGIVTFPFHPTLLALGRAGVSLAVLTVSSALYFVALFLGVIHYGLAGAASAYVLFYLIWSSLMAGLLLRYYRRLGSSAERSL